MLEKILYHDSESAPYYSIYKPNGSEGGCQKFTFFRLVGERGLLDWFQEEIYWIIQTSGS